MKTHLAIDEIDKIRILRREINNVEEQINTIEEAIKRYDLYFERDGLYEELFSYGCQHHYNKFYRKIAKELLPIAWHPDRAVDWCFDEDEKKDLHILWGNCDN